MQYTINRACKLLEALMKGWEYDTGTLIILISHDSRGIFVTEQKVIDSIQKVMITKPLQLSIDYLIQVAMNMNETDIECMKTFLITIDQ